MSSIGVMTDPSLHQQGGRFQIGLGRNGAECLKYGQTASVCLVSDQHMLLNESSVAKTHTDSHWSVWTEDTLDFNY